MAMGMLARAALLTVVAGTLARPAAHAKTLDIYFIDTEGGQATLVVAPSGQSLLIDTGWPGHDGRDANRIKEAAKKAGVKELDYVLITHFHRDHVGGVKQLLDQMKVRTMIDHGPNREQDHVVLADYATYEKNLPRVPNHMVVKPGDRIPLKGVSATVLTADGQHIASPLEGAGQPNPLCASAKKHDVDTSENARSLGTLIQYGKFRFVDMGDLTWNKELELVCPNNAVGTVDLFLVTHHGADLSNSPQFVHALHPRVAISNNGATKGGSPSAWQIVKDSPGLEDFWQLHYGIEGGRAHNVPDPFIANVDEQCQGKYIKVSAAADGSFTVFNSRNKYQKTYAAR
ncbi:MAG TPA: MBL fold metallo-hydrolase [Bryobacteraceae bacterium]|jgi:beta-lactamase superfamily II metal-dependent hydrolase|nr:MBL fold metallo-hydrolase [Bryobacteraceae bacterium]